MAGAFRIRRRSRSTPPAFDTARIRHRLRDAAYIAAQHLRRWSASRNKI